MIILQQNLICSPLEQFEVTNLISLYAPIFGYFNISLTNLGLYAILSISIIILLPFFTLFGPRTWLSPAYFFCAWLCFALESLYSLIVSSPASCILVVL